MKRLVKIITPPFLIEFYRALHRGRDDQSPIQNYLSGDYQTWDEALSDSTGYDASLILDRTKDALMRVKSGEAVYERDSVLFDEIQYSWPLLSSLMWCAAQSAGRLNVLDFGGSLGSTYFQNRRFLSALPDVRWNVVEQPLHVETGRRYFEDNNLKFFAHAEQCLAETKPNVILLSGVLQYLDHPYQILRELLDLSAIGCLVIDRTPFKDGTTDRLCVQHVPPHIYQASYPCWIFSLEKFRSILVEWNCVAEFEAMDRLAGPIEFRYKGMILTRRRC